MAWDDTAEDLVEKRERRRTVYLISVDPSGVGPPIFYRPSTGFVKQLPLTPVELLEGMALPKEMLGAEGSTTRAGLEMAVEMMQWPPRKIAKSEEE